MARLLDAMLTTWSNRPLIGLRGGDGSETAVYGHRSKCGIVCTTNDVGWCDGVLYKRPFLLSHGNG
ncbi:MAG: hypothetical protein H6668_05000 [Ardenticatenaceae bacterium]|nr:hypothetical protein [Ardenticatenaceae bacterium]